MCRNTFTAAAFTLLAFAALPGLANAAAPGLKLDANQIPGSVRLAAPPLPIQSKAGPAMQVPRQFAVAVATRITPQNAGSWLQLADGRWLWRVRVDSAGAKSLNFAIKNLHLPVAAELYVYDADGNAVRGPFVARNVRGGSLWTPVIDGDSAIVEVVAPAERRDQVSLEISQVNYGYMNLAGESGGSASCQVDVACNTGEAWGDEARSVAVFTFGGQFSCSGTLVNNTARDKTPYFLTAEHCINNAEAAASTVFYWNYQAASCGGQEGSLAQSQAGADLLSLSKTFVGYGGSDFALLELWEQPDPSFNVHYAGWDRRDLAPSSGVAGIHHPQGDQKKISVSDLATESIAIGDQDLTHLVVPGWTQGTMELGSSGSGLWNAERRLVGHLTGGTGAGCGNPGDSSIYGRLYYDWSGSSDPAHSIASYLDPLETGETVLDGMDAVPPPAKTTNVAAASEPASSGGSLTWGLVAVLALAGLLRRSNA